MRDALKCENYTKMHSRGCAIQNFFVKFRQL